MLRSCALGGLRAQEEIKLKAELAQPLADLQQAARAIGEVQRGCRLDVDVDAYVESFRPTLMDIIHAWSLVRSCCMVTAARLRHRQGLCLARVGEV